MEHVVYSLFHCTLQPQCIQGMDHMFLSGDSVWNTENLNTVYEHSMNHIGRCRCWSPTVLHGCSLMPSLPVQKNSLETRLSTALGGLLYISFTKWLRQVMTPQERSQDFLRIRRHQYPYAKCVAKVLLQIVSYFLIIGTLQLRHQLCFVGENLYSFVVLVCS